MFKFFKAVFNHFFNSNTFQEGASLAYYAVFSMLPIIIIVTSILGVLFGAQAVSGTIFTQLEGILGNDAAMQIQDIIKSQHLNHNSVLTTIIGFATLAYSASGMFSQVYNSFNRIWGIKENPKSSILKYLSKQALSFSVLLLLFLVIVGSTTLNTFLFKYVNVIQSASGITFIYEHLVSFIVFSVIFAIMYKLLGDAIIRWKPVVITGVFTAILFLIGKIGIGLYIGHSHITSTFGSASVLALIMLWVYYTSQIIFLGASFVKVLSEKMNCEILPNSNAVKAEYKEI